MALIKPLLKQGYCLITYDFYTSEKLADMLLRYIWDKETKSERNVTKNKKEKKIEKAESIDFCRGKVLAIKLKDKKDVTKL